MTEEKQEGHWERITFNDVRAAFNAIAEVAAKFSQDARAGAVFHVALFAYEEVIRRKNADAHISQIERVARSWLEAAGGQIKTVVREAGDA